MPKDGRRGPDVFMRFTDAQPEPGDMIIVNDGGYCDIGKVCKWEAGGLYLDCLDGRLVDLVGDEVSFYPLPADPPEAIRKRDENN